MAKVAWEYAVLPITDEIAGGGEEALETRLDELGTEGWELVGIDVSAEPTRYVFKRRFVAVRTDEESDGDDEDLEDEEDGEYDADGTIKVTPPPPPAVGRRPF